MGILFLKSVLALGMLCMAVIAIFTMYEILGRSEKRFDTGKLKKFHRINGICYFIIFGFITYSCLSFIISSKAELSARGTLHSIFSLTIIVLFALKLSIIRIYRQFYNQVKILGLLIALITFGVVGTSTGYYLLVTKAGTDVTFDKIMQYERRGPAEKAEKIDEGQKIPVKTDSGSIGRGKDLFDAKCSFCHDAYSANTIVGPGLKGVLKNPALPASGRTATPLNIKRQLREPFGRMPSFAYLSDGEVADTIAFLNAL